MGSIKRKTLEITGFEELDVFSGRLEDYWYPRA
jgi:hypothetical protein